MPNLAALLRDLDAHIAATVTDDLVEPARRDFSYLGHAKVPFLAPDPVKQAIAAEVNELLLAGGVRREVEFKETDYTPRRMRNVRRKEIAALGTVIPAVYQSQALREALARVVGEAVHICPYEPEQYVITCLERDGDTHGWHWDDYRFALVWVIETPPVDNGGFVQCVPGTTWDKQNPRINKAFVTRPIYSMELFGGDLYVMRTDTTLHRVYPVVRGVRKVINMGYAATANLNATMSHETMDGLWADDRTLAPHSVEI